MDEVEVGTVVEALLEGTKTPEANPATKGRRFTNPDVEYLTQRTSLNRDCVRSMLRKYGINVVLEALRRFATRGYEFPTGREEAVFMGICRGVEHANKETQ